MSGHPDDFLPDATLDGSGQLVLDEFTAHWEAALQKRESPPGLHEVMRRLTEAERAVLGHHLERIDSRFRQKMAETSGKEDTGGYSQVDTVSPDEASPDVTAFLAPGTVSDPGMTSDSKAISEPEATIDPSADLSQVSGANSSGAADAGTDPEATIDPDPHDPAATFFVTDGSAQDPEATLDPDQAERAGRAATEFSWDPDGADEEADENNDLPKIKGYKILCELGRGGMGVVYRGVQRGLNRLVAIKMILAGGHAGPEQLARFRLEAEAVAHMHHPHIVQIYDVGEQDGLPFFSLEFVDGYSLEYELAGQPQDPAHAAQMLEKIARGMHYAHEQGIVHRDLKPANILLTLDGVPKITDFGLVKRIEDTDSGQTRTGTIMGTPSFMAPEQARGEKEIGPRADVYAIGSILYMMLTGRPPFMGATPVDTLMQVLKEEPVAPSRLQPKVPIDLETICLKSLQKEPAKRYETAEELADDLQRYLNNEPIQARPVSTVERLWRWCRRNPRVAIPTGLAAFLILAMLITGPIITAVIYRQKQIAVDAQGIAERESKAARAAQTRAEAAEKSAQSNFEIATQQRLLALETLNKVVSEVEEELRDRAELNDLRQAVLALVLEGLDKVSGTDENADLANRNVGAVYQRIGDILLRAGKVDEALKQFQNGLTIFEKLLERDELNDLARWNAGLCYDGIADALTRKLADRQLIFENYSKALEYRQFLEDRGEALNKKIPAYMIKAGLVNSHARLGKLAMDLACDPAKAMDSFQQSVQYAEELLEELPDHPVARQSLAGSWFVLGQARYYLQHDDESSQLVDQAQQMRQGLLDEDGQSVKAQQDMAVTLWWQGDVALYNDQVDVALEHYTAAHQLRQALFDKDPKNLEMHEDLANSFFRLGTAQTLAQQGEEAQRSFAECRRLRESVVAGDPGNPGKQLDLALAQARCGMVKEALAQLDVLHSLFPNPGTLVELARGYSLCGVATEAQDLENSTELAEDYRSVARELLERAIDAGHNNQRQLQCHPDLPKRGQTPVAP